MADLNLINNRPVDLGGVVAAEGESRPAGDLQPLFQPAPEGLVWASVGDARDAVEVAVLEDGRRMIRAADKPGVCLVLSVAAWESFTGAVRDREYDVD